MIDKPEPEDASTPRFLIMDNTPLSLLGTIEALDWLFEPGCDVMITDMVIAAAIREPGESRDQRRKVREYVAGWLERNRDRITVLATVEPQRYEREMRLWERAGKPDDQHPEWSDRGERSVFSAVQDLKAVLAQTEEIIVIMDDRDGRDAVRAVRADIALMGTRTFIRWMEEDFGIESAATVWQVIRTATADTAGEGAEEDPVYIRRR
ncbi:hypothetical protein [Rhizobium sp. BK376]|uniref:hypothetical protein n=1 Tax=Rhizobium sp. BK376 TaxID=2512149 RepID=UPI00104839B6|nr:hypothetical protein [Rhizobium sp. BK376]TCR85276.1 hypothetical protein EV561_10747 [Rhizobium sp. BK376]